MLTLNTTPKASLLTTPTTPTTPAPSIITALTADLQADARQAMEKELQREKTVLHLDELAAARQRHMDALAAREPEVAAVFKETTIAPADRTSILQHRPGLQALFDAVDQKRGVVDGLMYGVQSTLARGLDQFKRLTPADIEPRKERGETLLYTPLGTFAPVIWHLYEMLGNVRPLADLDEAIAHLRTALRELTERLATPAAIDVRQPQAPILTVPPRENTEPPTITRFNSRDPVR